MAGQVHPEIDGHVAPGAPLSTHGGGDLSLMRQLSLDFAADNIRVLAVNPGTINTPMVHAASGVSGAELESALIDFGKDHPLNRVGQPEEIANLALYLCSDEASHAFNDPEARGAADGVGQDPPAFCRPLQRQAASGSWSCRRSWAWR